MWKCPKCGRVFPKANQGHYCGQQIDTVDAYIQEQAAEIRPILEELRATIRNAAPDAIEKISWRMPTFWQEENLIHFAAFKNHIGVYPGELSRLPFAARLKGYKTTKGAIQFPLSRPIDHKLIADITKFRVVQIKEKPSRMPSNGK